MHRLGTPWSTSAILSARSVARSAHRCISRAISDVPQIPLTDYVSSTQNTYVKHCAKLRSNRKYREQLGRTLLCGQGVIQEQMAAANIQIEVILSTEPSSLPNVLRQGAWHVIGVAPHVMNKLTGLEESAGIRAVAEVHVPRKDISREAIAAADRILVLDAIQDPGNLGTLLRTAAALSWDTVCLLDGCCDPYNDKAIRAARGATFQVNICSGSWNDVCANIKDQGFTLVAAEPSSRAGDAEDVSAADAIHKLGNLRVALVLGSEGQGVTPEVLRDCMPVGIPMPGNMESLNVGVAGAMLMLVFSSALEPLLVSVGSRLTTPRRSHSSHS